MEWWEDAKKLTEVRKARNVSQARLARMAGVTASLICQIEKGTKPLTKEVAQKVWDALADVRFEQKDLNALKTMGVDKTPEAMAREEAESLRKENERLRNAEKAMSVQDRLKDKYIDALRELVKIQSELIAAHAELRHAETEKRKDLEQRVAEYKDLLGLETNAVVARSDADEQREKILSAKGQETK
jgi:transcriptional regulator with XRE-family HTH domain